MALSQSIDRSAISNRRPSSKLLHGNVEKISVVSIGRMKEFIDRNAENAERAYSLCFSLRLSAKNTDRSTAEMNIGASVYLWWGRVSAGRRKWRK